MESFESLHDLTVISEASERAEYSQKSSPIDKLILARRFIKNKDILADISEENEIENSLFALSIAQSSGNEIYESATNDVKEIEKHEESKRSVKSYLRMFDRKDTFSSKIIERSSCSCTCSIY